MRGLANRQCTAFQGQRRVASGTLTDVVRAVKSDLDRDDLASVLIFDDATSETIEVDFRGTAEAVVRRLTGGKGAIDRDATPGDDDPSSDAPRGPGRPKLGVVAREVTLLPRHWEWLGGQPGGASVALRKLVEEARRAHAGRDRTRRAQESAYRFLAVMAGDRPGFEEATRALFAHDRPRFTGMTKSWPTDVRAHARKLAATAFDAGASETAGSVQPV